MAVLFPGSGGLINLRSENGQPKFGQGNFLVRSRAEFVKRGVIAAIIDAPSDQQSGWGMSDEFRLGDAHFTDISAVIDDLDKRFPGVPLFLIGTSRGTISAAALGARLGPRPAGAILTSTMFRQAPRKSKEPGPGLSNFDFATIKIPVSVRAPRERSMRSYTVQRRGAAIGQVSIDHGVWRCAAAVGTVRCLQRAWLFRQRGGNCRTDCQLDA